MVAKSIEALGRYEAGRLLDQRPEVEAEVLLERYQTFGVALGAISVITSTLHTEKYFESCLVAPNDDI